MNRFGISCTILWIAAIIGYFSIVILSDYTPLAYLIIIPHLTISGFLGIALGNWQTDWEKTVSQR